MSGLSDSARKKLAHVSSATLPSQLLKRGFRNQCLQDASAASIGDILMTRLQVRGVAGFVSDSGIRESHKIAGQSHEQEKMEVFLREEIVSGHPLHGMYPPNGAIRARYVEWQNIRDPAS